MPTTQKTPSQPTRLAPKVRAKLPGLAYSVHRVAFSPDGTLMASGRHGPDVLLTRTDNGQPHRTLTGGDSTAIVLAFSPDGTRLAVDDAGDVITVWDTSAGKLVHSLPVKGTVRDGAFSPDGKTLAAAVGKSIVLWDAAAGTVLAKIDSKAIVERTIFLPDGRLVTKVGKRIDVRDPRTGAGLTIEDKGSAIDLDVSTDGTTILTAPGGKKRHATLWDVATGKERVVLKVDDDGGIVFGAKISPDGTRAFTLDRNMNLRLWDAATGELLTTWTGPTDHRTGGVSFSPDGKLLAAQYDELRLYDLTSLDLAATLPFVCGNSHCLTFSPDGHCLAAGSKDAVMLWSLR